MDPGEDEQIPPIQSIDYRAKRELLKHQRLNYTEILQTLGYSPEYQGVISDIILNTSPVGAGKTTVTCLQISFINPKNVVVICPSGNIVETWKRTLGFYKLDDISDIYSYYDITAKGKGAVETKARLTKEVSKTKYRPSKKLNNLLEEGVVIVFDEASYIKNDESKRTASALCISQTLISKNKEYRKQGLNPKNRLIFLSATPTDKDEKKFVWLGHLGVMNTNRPYTYTGGGAYIQYHTEGLKSIKKWLKANEEKILNVDNQDECKIINEDEYNTVIDYLGAAIKNPKQLGKKSTEYVYDIIAYKTLMSSMPADKPKRGLIYTLLASELHTREEREIILDKIQERVILEEDKETGKITAQQFFIKMTPILLAIERQKAHLFARLADEFLQKNPNTKIVIQMNYYEALDLLEEDLEELGYGKTITRIYGQIGDEEDRRTMHTPEREKNRLKFQRFDNKYRIMLLSKVGQMGIDLDDQSPDGEFPRTLLTPSTYFTTEIIQTMGRIHRVSSTSDSVGILVFYDMTEKMTARHTQKTKTLKETTIGGSISITDITPYANYKARRGNCDFFSYARVYDEEGELVKNKDREVQYELVKYNFKINLGEFDERAYRVYESLNPIDLRGANTPKSGSFVQVTVILKGKMKDLVTIATDLTIDTERLFNMDIEELISIINDFYFLNRFKYKVIKIKKIEELDYENVTNIDFYFPGFRKPDKIFNPKNNGKDEVEYDDE